MGDRKTGYEGTQQERRGMSANTEAWISQIDKENAEKSSNEGSKATDGLFPNRAYNRMKGGMKPESLAQKIAAGPDRLREADTLNPRSSFLGKLRLQANRDIQSKRDLKSNDPATMPRFGAVRPPVAVPFFNNHSS